MEPWRTEDVHNGGVEAYNGALGESIGPWSQICINWMRNRIRIRSVKLDPDPHLNEELDPDPQYCIVMRFRSPGKKYFTVLFAKKFFFIT
jgi:hypothetical protein